MKKLAIITTHPIQYNAPFFKLLSERKKIKIKVFYTWGEDVLKSKFDPGFGKKIQWDIPLLEGYEFEFVKNISKQPGSHHFKGIDNPSLIKEVHDFDPDAILMFGWSFKSHLKVLRHFYGKKKILFRGDSTLLNEKDRFSFKKLARGIFLKWIYKHVDIALYVGSNNKKYYKNFGLRENQLIFGPHAIDNERFAKAQRNNFRNQCRIKEDEIVFLFAGKFESVKNPVLLLNAFIEANLKDAHLVMVGNGHLEKELKILAREFSKNIHFINFQNQSKMPDVYQTADVCILSSQSETWGLSVNEAMASSRAVLVSSKCGCAVDLVKDGINGYLFESNKRESIIVKMKLLMAQKENIKKMGQQSFEIIQDWSFKKVAEAIEQTLQ